VFDICSSIFRIYVYAATQCIAYRSSRFYTVLTKVLMKVWFVFTETFSSQFHQKYRLVYFVWLSQGDKKNRFVENLWNVVSPLPLLWATLSCYYRKRVCRNFFAYVVSQ